MSKDIKKRRYTVHNKDVIERLRAKYGTTPHFIYASIRGDRVSETSLRICEDYLKAEKQITQILSKI